MQIYISPVDEVYMRIDSDDKGLLREIADHYTFKVPGYKFMPAYKLGRWDGTIRLFSTVKRKMYRGLLESVKKFAEKRNVQVHVDPLLEEKYTITEEQFRKFVNELNIPNIKDTFDYQDEAVMDAIREKRRLILSPTGSGKSLMIYLLTMWFGVKTLIIVPRIALVNQLAGDFEEYGYKNEVHKVFSGKDKYSDNPITITTWQSIYKLKSDWFDQYDMVIVDEVHNATANSLKNIMEKMTRCELRYGFTGTLDEAETHELVLTGLFGPVRRAAWTHELIERDVLSDLKIRVLVLHYDDAIKRSLHNSSYDTEIDFIVTHPERNKMIVNLANKLPGNTLILYRFVEKQGKKLFEMLQDTNEADNVFHYYGGTDVDEREAIRKVLETKKNAKIAASIQTFGEGVNVKNLDNIILASPSKKRIKNLQAIGRILRKSGNKTAMTYDIADNLQLPKERPNHTLRHFSHRIKTYQEEKFDFTIHNITLGVNK